MKPLMHYLTLTMALCLLAGSALPAAAGDYEPHRFVFFGDSLTDPGNHYYVYGQVSLPPYQPVPIYPYAIGGHHFSNGDTWAEDLTEELGAPASGKAALREPGFFTNYAFGRARARPNAPTFPDFDLGSQVGTFLTDFKGHAPADRTYMVWIGANDLFDALEALEVDPSGETSGVIIEQAIGGVAANLETLWGAGARSFLIVNLPDPALTPYVRSLGPAAQGAATQLTAAFNGALAQVANEIAQLPQVRVQQFDINAFLHTVVASPARYGLRDVQNSCLAFGVTTNAVCADPDRHLFWDGIHPTRVGHLLISFAIIRAEVIASLQARNPEALSDLPRYTTER